VHRTLNPEFNETISVNGVLETDMAKKFVRLAVIGKHLSIHIVQI
jgi:hypothetical protein